MSSKLCSVPLELTSCTQSFDLEDDKINDFDGKMKQEGSYFKRKKHWIED